MLRGVPDGGSCTALANFTTYLNWDFGIITLKGITSDVTLQHVVVAGKPADLCVHDRFVRMCAMQQLA